MQINVVVAGAIGMGAIIKLNLENIKAYRSAGAIVKDSFDLFVAGSLRELTLDCACSGGKSRCSYLWPGKNPKPFFWRFFSTGKLFEAVQNEGLKACHSRPNLTCPY